MKPDRKSVKAYSPPTPMVHPGRVTSAARDPWKNAVERENARLADFTGSNAPPISIKSAGAADGFASGLQINATALTIWALSDIITKRLEAMLPPDAPDALSESARVTRLAEIEAELLALNRTEVALIELAHEQGNMIAYRRDTDPRAALSLI
jgi:hypothetical protein